MSDNSLPQFTPEQVAEKHRLAEVNVEMMIQQYNIEIQTHIVDGQKLYCVYDWFRSFYVEGLSLEEWCDIVLRFLIKETPVSLSTQLLPYKHDKYALQLEFGPALALVYLQTIDDEMETPDFTSQKLSACRQQLPDYNIYPEPKVRRQKLPKGYLYMIHIDGMDEYKIGYTENFQRRFGQYKMHTPPSTLWVVDYVHEAYLPKNVEASIHRILDRFRVGGEWFRLDKNWALVTKAALTVLQSSTKSFEDADEALSRVAQFLRDAGYDVTDENFKGRILGGLDDE